MRLNLGCGSVYRKGFVNADAFDRTVADLSCELASLPFRDGCFDSVECHHVIEHLGYIRAIYALSECFRVLEPSGRLVLETPDIEASFRAFLRERSDEGRAFLLTWIFGYDSPGQSHRMLYPSRLLVMMLEEAGFRNVKIGEPETHLYGRGLRVTAAKGGGVPERVAARFRPRIVRAGIADLGDHFAALELERRLVRGLLRFRKGPRKNRGAATGALVYSPAGVLAWIGAVGECGDEGFEGFDDLAELAGILAELSLPDRLYERVMATAESPRTAGDAYERVSGNARRMVTRLYGRRRKDIVSEVDRHFPPAGRTGTAVFSRRLVEAEMGRLRDGAIRDMAVGDYERAIRPLRLSVNSGMGGFYAAANYAVLLGIFGKYREAARLYRAAAAFEAGDRGDRAVREEAVKCLLHRRDCEAAREAAEEIGDGKLRRFWKAVSRYHAGDRTGALRGLRRLRSEGFRHELLMSYLDAAGDPQSRRRPLPALRTDPLEIEYL